MKTHSIYKTENGRKITLQQYESYLSRFSTRFDRVAVETRFGKPHTLVGGPADGKPLFLFQRGNCIQPMTLSWFSSLLDEFRIYAPDTIGHPGYSDERRISAQDDSFAWWASDLMDHFGVKESACAGASYGAGILLRLAASQPNRIRCAVLVSPAGITVGPKWNMIKQVLVPLLRFKCTGSDRALQQITDALSCGKMSPEDRAIIGDIFRHVRLERNMPKLAQPAELASYNAPTMLAVGQRDIFFPGDAVIQAAQDLFPHLVVSRFDEMGHFPTAEWMPKIQQEIREFLHRHA